MSISKRYVIMNVVIMNVFPLVWMFHSRASRSNESRLHERCLRIIHSDKASSFEAPLEKDGSLTFEMFEAVKGLFPPIITEPFEKKNEHEYNLRHNFQFTIPAVNSAYYGTESVSFLCPKKSGKIQIA